MTEQQFINVNHEIWQNGEWWCSAGGEHCADVIATALNTFIDEKKEINQNFYKLYKEYEDLELKNKMLKHKIEKLKQEKHELTHQIAMIDGIDFTLKKSKIFDIINDHTEWCKNEAQRIHEGEKNNYIIKYDIAIKILQSIKQSINQIKW